jgi:predicted transcriptional regulator
MNESTKVRIPTRLRNRARLYAVATNQTLQAVATKAIEDFLERNTRTETRPAPRDVGPSLQGVTDSP